jgi:hypothetical protein
MLATDWCGIAKPRAHNASRICIKLLPALVHRDSVGHRVLLAGLRDQRPSAPVAPPVEAIRGMVVLVGQPLVEGPSRLVARGALLLTNSAPSRPSKISKEIEEN